MTTLQQCWEACVEKHTPACTRGQAGMPRARCQLSRQLPGPSSGPGQQPWGRYSVADLPVPQHQAFAVFPAALSVAAEAHECVVVREALRDMLIMSLRQ